MQYAILLTGLVAAASAFKFPQLKKLEERQAPSATGPSTVPSTTVLTTVTVCPSTSTVTSGSSTFVRTGNVTRTITTTVCSSSRRHRATGTGFPVRANTTAYYPSLSYASAYFPVNTGTSVSLQQQINNYLNIKNTLNLRQQQAQFQQLTQKFAGVATLTQQQASFFASESKQLFGSVQTVSAGSKVTASPGQIYVSAGTTFASGAQPTPLPPSQSQAPGIASFKGDGSKTTITTGSALLAAIAAAFAL